MGEINTKINIDTNLYTNSAKEKLSKLGLSIKEKNNS